VFAQTQRCDVCWCYEKHAIDVLAKDAL